MKKKYDAIIVGGGIAGHTSAAYLCRARLIVPIYLDKLLASKSSKSS